MVCLKEYPCLSRNNLSSSQPSNTASIPALLLLLVLVLFYLSTNRGGRPGGRPCAIPGLIPPRLLVTGVTNGPPTPPDQTGHTPHYSTLQYTTLHFFSAPPSNWPTGSLRNQPVLWAALRSGSSLMSPRTQAGLGLILITSCHLI